jgi:hypothetical protein
MKRLTFLLAVILLAGCAPVGDAQPQMSEAAPSAVAAPVGNQSQTSVVEAPSGQASGTGEVEIVGGDEATLRGFIQRYLTQVYPGAPAVNAKVWIGKLPDDLPVEIPLPEGARVVASVRQPQPYTQIILDVPQTPEEITAFYAKALSENGWQPAPQGPPGGGFVGPAEVGERYCLKEGEAYVEIWSQEKPGGPTDVRLNLTAPADFHMCQERGPESMDQGMSLIPSLKAPRGAQMTGGGGGSSSDGSAYSSTDMESSLTAEELLAHYNAQLEAAGWELVDQGLTDGVGWSAWKLADKDGKEWGGTLLVMEGRLIPERRFALVSVERLP